MSVRGETLAGARLAAGLIRVVRRHGDAQDHAALLEEHGLGGPDALPVRERLVLAGRLSRWAGRLRPVFAADGPRDRADAVAALLEGVPIRALLSASACPETSPVWRFTAASADGSGSLDDVLGQVQATTAGALAWLVVDGEGDRLDLCGLPGCRAAFVDERDRGRRRRFCSDRCRAAAAVRTHRDRAWLREHGGGSPAAEECAGMGPGWGWSAEGAR